MTSFRDWVVETSSTTGTGSYSLSGSPPAGTSYFTFRQRYSNGEDEVSYWVVSADRTKWEKNRFGTLTYGSPDTLSRNVVESTNGDAPVSWVGGDGPLRIYVVPDADAEEFAISMGLGAARPDVLKYGQWADEDGLATGFDQIKHFDGTADDVVGVVNKTANEATIYGLPPGFLYGMTLSRPSTTTISIAAGIAMDSTNVVGIRLGSAITKSTAGAWAAGSASNGMADGVTIGNSTWYHVFAGLADGVADAFIDTSVSGANAPSEFTHFRRVGSFLTNGSAQIIDFVQDGDLFLWAGGPVQDASLTDPGTSIVLRTMSVPTGINVFWHGKIQLQNTNTGNTSGAGVGSPSQSTVVNMLPNVISATIGVASANTPPIYIRTNTSAQINTQVFNFSSALVTFTVSTFGWRDRRGRDG